VKAEIAEKLGKSCNVCIADMSLLLGDYPARTAATIWALELSYPKVDDGGADWLN
jgi:hypothetical protein